MHFDEQTSLKLIEKLPEGVHKEIYKRVITQLVSTKNGESFNNKQFINDLSSLSKNSFKAKGK